MPLTIRLLQRIWMSPEMPIGNECSIRKLFHGRHLLQRVCSDSGILDYLLILRHRDKGSSYSGTIVLLSVTIGLFGVFLCRQIMDLFISFL